MTKDEIKKALECCNSAGLDFCVNCPYSRVARCRDELIASALNLITEQEAEIDRLKAKDEETCLKCIESKHATAEEYAKLQEEFANYQLASDKEIRAQVKQAKIDVLSKLKTFSRCDNFFPDGKWHRYVFVNYIDRLIEEIENV